MLVIVKSGPDTVEWKRALSLAQDMKTGICLIQNGVYFCLQDVIQDLAGTVYAIDEDMKLRGVAPSNKVRTIDYVEAIDLMAQSDKVIGMF